MDEQQPDQAALAVVARHALHDEELMAAFAGGDVEAGEEADRAQSLTERCPACRDLYRDIQLIDGLIRAAETSAEYGARVNAPRDFRLSLEDARRLGGPAPVRGIPAGGVMNRLRAALVGIARPLGASMATLGVAGLLVGSMTVGSGAMPIAIDNGVQRGGSPAGELGPASGPSATRGSTTSLSSGATAGPARSSADGTARPSTPGAARTPANGEDTDGMTIGSSSTVLQAGSVALLLGGLALLTIGMVGRGARRQ